MWRALTLFWYLCFFRWDGTASHPTCEAPDASSNDDNIEGDSEASTRGRTSDEGRKKFFRKTRKKSSSPSSERYNNNNTTDGTISTTTDEDESDDDRSRSVAKRYGRRSSVFASPSIASRTSDNDATARHLTSSRNQNFRTLSHSWMLLRSSWNYRAVPIQDLISFFELSNLHF